VLVGKYRGQHTGRIAIRFEPWFRLLRFGVHPNYLTKIHRVDGYDYSLGETFHPTS
jgi:hypothetical protein